MVIYLARTYVVSCGKLKAHNRWGKKLVGLMKKNPRLFGDVISLRVFRHNCAGSVDLRFTAVWGLASLASIEGWENEFTEIPQEEALRTEFTKLVVSGSCSACILDPIKIVKRKNKSNCPKK